MNRNYTHWVAKYDRLSDADRAHIRRHVDSFSYTPLISVVMPVYNPPEWAFAAAVESVRNQLYPHWELCIADDASPAPHVARLLVELATAEPRIRYVCRERNGNISAASNSALTLVTGEFVALMDHDDLLSEHALYHVAVALNRNPSLDLIYSDEDEIDAAGRRHTPYFKTDWNPDLMHGHNMVSHLGVYRKSLLDAIGGFREGYEGSQDYDLALRGAGATTPDRIHHIPEILYHWRRNYGQDSFSEQHLGKCLQAAMRAIADDLARRGDPGEVRPHPLAPNWSYVHRPIPTPAPLVSVIVPTRDRADLLQRCADGILNGTNYPSIELLIVDHDSTEAETLTLFAQLKSDARVRILPYSGPFNYSAINNMAVAAARGSIVALVNNDVEVIDPDWLSNMVALASLDGVGAVGAKLLYPDGRVQHGGVVLGVGGVANHFSHLLRRSSRGYFGRNILTSAVSAVTGACLLVRKSIYEDVGGLNAQDLPVAFNDVDLCLKIRRRGYRNVWTPFAELYHHESASRGAENNPEKIARFTQETNYMKRVWGECLVNDPYYNSNLSDQIGESFDLAFPPRTPTPWQTTAATSNQDEAR
ncbi:glycosyltransferase family 2 protein [Rhodopseudomonas palustris]|uniref:glycosyltransferase family 2 protein n=1 Tax=Rhodopseudomonas palustris TaxID=1076 RepID=UPI0021F2FCC9|nr:glycosyltransferase family 2 protein [Rhodopseudomonas palustris]UYO53121.1 glycosyltransferase family 2 protein [Rhodopseudomonas palustris]